MKPITRTTEVRLVRALGLTAFALLWLLGLWLVGLI